MDEQPMVCSNDDWDIAIMHGQYSQGDDRDDMVTFRRIDLAAYLGQVRAEQAAEIAWLDGYADEIREALGTTLSTDEALFRIRNVMRLWDKRRNGPIREDLPPD